MTSVAIVDDRSLFRKGLSQLLADLGYNVIFEAANEKDLLQALDKDCQPDVLLIDSNMLGTDACEITKRIRKGYPVIKVLALSTYDTKDHAIKMVDSGAHGFILKEAEPSGFRNAIKSLIRKGYYYPDLTYASVINKFNKADIEDN